MSKLSHTVKYYDSFKSAPAFSSYSKVVIQVSDDVEYVRGSDTGRVMTVSCPWANAADADFLLSEIECYQHQPFEAVNAILDPAAELGDVIYINGVYSAICSMETKFGGLCRTTISAPGDEEIDHEFPFVEKQQRQVTRKLKQLTAELKIQANQITATVSSVKNLDKAVAELKIQASEISAEVVKQEGGDSKSFAWSLKPAAFKLTANGTEVFKVNKNGASIKGKITADSGKIGGFDIKGNYLTYNGQTWTGKLDKGIYIGIQGIKLGTKFKVDRQGNLEASSGKFTGTVYAGNIVSGVDSKTGVNYGTMPGSGIAPGTLGITQLSSGVNASLTNADDAYNVLFKNARAKAVACDQLSADQIFMGTGIMSGKLRLSTIAYKGTDNKNHVLNVVTWDRGGSVA